jgi:SOS-response transcriptional repressor LexA
LVLFQEGQPLLTLWPADCPPVLKRLWGNYKLIYRVDVTEHWFGFDCDLPCKGDGFHLQAQVHVFYCVDDPAMIVERNVSDAYEVLRPLIIRTLRRISREHDVEEIGAVEKIMTRTVKNQVRDTGFGIKRCVVNLSLEEDARAYIRKLRQIERDKELEKREAGLQKQQDQLEIERLKIKMSFYSPLVRQGHWQLLALQLAQHPQDVVTIAQMLGQCRQAETERQLQVLKTLLDTGALEKMIPLLQRLPASAAGPITADMIEAKIPVNQAVQTNDLRQIGIVEGDIVLVRCQDEVENGSVAVVIPVQQRAQTQYILRRVFYDKYRFRLVAECPGLPSVTLAQEAAAKRIRVIGRVVGVKKRYPHQQDWLDVIGEEVAK